MPLMPLRPPSSPLRRLGARALTGVVLVMATAAPAVAQTAATLYERAQARERETLAASPVTPEALRTAARAYEVIVLRYPTSGYSDNALWQAACLLQTAYGLSGVGRDRDGAARYFSWLKREYPHSSLGRQSGPQPIDVPERATTASEVPSTPAAPPPSREATVTRVSRAELPGGERITIELSDEVAYSGERVGNPDRIYFDFPSASAAATLARSAAEIHGPLVKAVRTGSPTPGITRVVLEVDGEPKFSVFPLYAPFRVVIDVETSAATRPAAAPAPSQQPVAAPRTAPPPAETPAPAAPTRKGEYSLARQLGARVARIVIDPGHGGHDPGAQANGVTEAELVLDVALRLEKLLEQQPGVEVVLTRRTNEFIPLEERTAIANRANADLFLSIHANAHRQAAIRGIESYVLNFASNPEAEAVAARENATSAQTMGTIPAIVKAIALNDKLAESREFAAILQTSLVRRVRNQSAGVKDLGVKQAPFVVLIGAQMPSVLTEIAFLTNKTEASLAKQAAFRQTVAQALREAVTRYQESLKRITTLAVQDERR